MGFPAYIKREVEQKLPHGEVVYVLIREPRFEGATKEYRDAIAPLKYGDFFLNLDNGHAK